MGVESLLGTLILVFLWRRDKGIFQEAFSALLHTIVQDGWTDGDTDLPTHDSTHSLVLISAPRP